jgi:putative alpha-1,2-mannosidase
VREWQIDQELERAESKAEKKAAVMAWDDELAKLAVDVRKTLGDETFDAAITRALSAVVHPSQEGESLTPDDGTLESPHGRVFSTNTFYEALRTELQRLLRPH